MALRRIRPNLLGEPTAVLLHRNVFDRFGLFNPHLASCCDLEYWIRVASHTGTIHIRDVLATFRVHAGSMSAYLTQTAAGRYRSEVLDPLLIVHDYAFHPVYGELRRVAERCRPPHPTLERVLEARAGRSLACESGRKRSITSGLFPTRGMEKGGPPLSPLGAGSARKATRFKVASHV